MRLLEARSIFSETGLILVERHGNTIPPYAILSHTWGEDEVLYTDVLNGTSKKREAFIKVKYACYQAVADGLEHVWIDTCCIDKRSSAELSEAINSMYAWYNRAEVCYAFLSDYMSDDGVTFSGSRWFTRGWTLQELIAPARVEFYASGWVSIGNKESLSEMITAVTRINEDILLGHRPIETTSIANRMGWAAHRVTTRPEDMAYCLLGIFSVNMPLLYGEGTNAFIRLQEEIMKRSTDHTLFAWKDKTAPDDREYGMLAPSPFCFAETHMLVPYTDWATRAPYSMTNEGLSIRLHIHNTQNQGQYLGLLACPPLNFEEFGFITIHLKDIGQGSRRPNERFVRIKASKLGQIQKDLSIEHAYSHTANIFVHQTPKAVVEDWNSVFPCHYITLEVVPASTAYRVDEITTLDGLKVETPPDGQMPRYIVRRGAGRVSVAVSIIHKPREKLLLIIGCIETLELGFDFKKVCDKSSRYNGRYKGKQRLEKEIDVKSAFHPHPLSKVVQDGNHMVGVHEEIQFSKGCKFHHLSINIQHLNAPPKKASMVSTHDELLFCRSSLNPGGAKEK